jgi:hypothetical protein
MSDEIENKPGEIEKRPDQALIQLVEKILENQAAIIRNESAQIELQKQNLTESYQYAKGTIEAQLEDRKDTRDHQRKIQRERMTFAGILVLVLALFVGYSLYLNKDQIALEIIKAIAFLAAGGMGGYAVGRYRSSQAKDGE